MTDLFCNSKRQKTKNLLIDPGSSSGPYSYTLFPRTFSEVNDRDNAQLAFSPTTNRTTPITLVADLGHTILDPDTNVAVTTYELILQGEAAHIVFFDDVKQWAFAQTPDANYAEIWRATPIVSMAGGVTLQWTLVPLFVGQVALVFTHSAGVLTYQLSDTRIVKATFKEESQMNLVGNNQDVTWDYTPNFSGAGISTFVRIIDAFAHTRTANFLRSGMTLGNLLIANGDTLSIVGTSAGAGGATVDLVDGFLAFEIDL